MTKKEVVQLVIRQMGEVQTEHHNLELVLSSSGEIIVQGTIWFSVNHKGRTVKDEYKIEIIIPTDYPDSPPTVRETGKTIPDDFHKFSKSGNLCLAAPVEVRRVFAKYKTLLSFINFQVIPYLFSYSYFKDYGELPYGDLAHGMIGLLNYYKDFFGVDAIRVMKLLKLLADDRTPPLMKCPCDSGKALQDCHGQKLNELRLHYSHQEFAVELRDMITGAQWLGIRFPERNVMPCRMWKRREKHRRKAVRFKKRRPSNPTYRIE